MISKRAAFAALMVIAASAPAKAAVTVSTAATQNMTCSAGVCAPTAIDAVLNVTDLENLLAAGDVEVTTTGTTIDARDIRVGAALGWTTSSLDLSAERAIEIYQPVSVPGPGSGLSLTTGAKKEPGGRLSFGPHGSVTFADVSDLLSINGVSYALVNSVASLANAVAANPADNYALANNYDASADGTYSSAPVTTTFSGTFEGLGNSISNMSISDTASYDYYVGLFARESSATLRDISLTNANVFGGAYDSDVGALVGEEDNANFINVSVSGMVTAASPVTDTAASAGGLAGYGNGGIVRHCMSSAAVTVSVAQYGYAGGLFASGGGFIEFSNSLARGDVTSTDWAGGLFGTLSSSPITTSFSTGHIKGYEVGGLAGYTDSSTVTNFYSTARTATISHQSGVVGGLFGSLEIGNVVSTSYSAGGVGGGGYEASGGFAGVAANSSFSSDYWDTTTSHKKRGVGNEKNAQGLTGLTTEQLQSGLPPGFDPAVWAEDSNINNGLPYLINNRPPN